MKYSAYLQYKPSGVEWLGETPEHWEVYKVAHGFIKIGSGTTPRSDSDEYYDGNIPWVTTSELRETVIHDTRQLLTRKAMDDHTTLRIYPTGTLLFAMYGATIGRMGTLGIPATVNQACCAFSSPTVFNIRFVFYWLWTRRPILISLSTGGGQPNLSQDDLRQIRIPIPPLPEQRAIADFLDAKTAKIDTLLAKKRELIEKLKEKRAALISQAVTHGLPPEVARAAGINPYPRLKPSGIDWIGYTPEHWEIVQLRYISFMKAGIGITSDSISEDEKYPVYGGNGIRGYTSDYTHDGEYVLVGRQGALCGNVGFASGKFWASEHAVVVTPLRNTDVYWLGKLLESMNLNQYSLAAAQPGLAVDNIKMLFISYPPIEEQHVISDFLKREVIKLDYMVTKIEEAIERLQEYRIALITAAVTGKIDVREATA